jgi:hypothetical protein
MLSVFPVVKSRNPFNHGGHGATRRRGTEGCRNSAVISVFPVVKNKAEKVEWVEQVERFKQEFHLFYKSI